MCWSKKVLAVAVVLMSLSLSSCVHRARYISEINSLAQSNTSEMKRYLLLPGEKETDPSDLQFMEFSGLVEKILKEQGFIKVEAPEEAQIAVFLSYGIGNPQTHQYSYSVPIYGQTGVSSSQTFGTISSFGGMGTYSATTTYTPRYGVTGYSRGVDSYTTHTRFLQLTAFDLVSFITSKKTVQLWKTEVTSTGSSNDLRLVFPYMAAAMMPYIGTNTDHKIKVSLPENDPKVLSLRGIKTPPPQPSLLE